MLWPYFGGPWVESRAHATLKSKGPYEVTTRLPGWLPRWMPLLVGAVVVIGIAFDLRDAVAAVGDHGAHVRGRVRRHAAGAVGAHAGDSSRGRAASTATSCARRPSTSARSSGPTASCAGAACRPASSAPRSLTRSSGNDTYLFTNEHVAAWPDVTDTLPPHRRRPRGVQAGRGQAAHRARRARRLRARADRAHARGRRSRCSTPPSSRRSQKLTVIPYKIGKSAGLRQGNAVDVRGFPLGVMQAVSSGKVVNPYDRDQEQGWDHVDFVIDALLAEGNSGSPVLAASCKSRDLELVGVYHAGYKGHGALNVVVGIDQLSRVHAQEEAASRGRSPRARPGALAAADAGAGQGDAGGRHPPAVRLRRPLRARRDRRRRPLLYHFYGRQFPLDDRRVAVIEDLPKEGAFGELGRLWVLGQTGWREWPPAGAGHGRARPARPGRRTRFACRSCTRVDYRQRAGNPSSADERRRGRDLSRAIARDVPVARDLAAEPARHRRPALVGARSECGCARPGGQRTRAAAGIPGVAAGRPAASVGGAGRRATRGALSGQRAARRSAVPLADQRQDGVLRAVVAVAEARLHRRRASCCAAAAASGCILRGAVGQQDQQVLVDLADLLLALLEERLAQLGDRAREDLRRSRASGAGDRSTRRRSG